MTEGDKIASEHVEILTRNPRYFLDNMTNYGAIFLGPETNVAYGDTMRLAPITPCRPKRRLAIPAGCGWASFSIPLPTKNQECTPEASVTIGEYGSRLSEIEGFWGHKGQADLRVRRYSSD